MDPSTQERLVQIMQEHKPTKDKYGFVDCTCGWQSNHPRKWTKKQLEMQADPSSLDPVEPKGEWDTEHATDEAFQMHLSALQMGVMESQEGGA